MEPRAEETKQGEAERRGREDRAVIEEEERERQSLPIPHATKQKASRRVSYEISTTG